MNLTVRGSFIGLVGYIRIKVHSNPSFLLPYEIATIIETSKKSKAIHMKLSCKRKYSNKNSTTKKTKRATKKL